MADECDAIVDATTVPTPPYAQLAVAAVRGRAEQVETIIRDVSPSAQERGEGQWLVVTDWATAVLNNGLGWYDQALEAAERATRHTTDLDVVTWATVELVEAASRSGAPERGVAAAERLGKIADACESNWIVGLAARSRALLASDDTAESSYRQAIERLARTPMGFELARAQLVYGEWLRRQNRRSDAREHLRAAHKMLSESGVEAFAERARRELMATGETVRKRTADTAIDLTEQEGQIASMAAEGHTNMQIGTQLFLSARTVEWHLRKVFAKLGITSRKELSGSLPSALHASFR